MAGFYKVAVKGTAGGQEIINVLYYSTLAPDTLTWDAGVAEDLGQAVLDAWAETFIPWYPQAYTLQSADVSMVNEDGAVTSPFTVTVVDPITGAQANGLATPGQCIIAKFNCEPVTLVNSHPVPKRSYLALGPQGEANIGDDGAFAQVANWQTASTAVLTQGHLIGVTEYLPHRVGRTTTANAAGVGRVTAVIIRPFASFRRSRIRKPTGN